MGKQSFIDFIEQYGKKHRPSMTYDGNEDPTQWQERFRQKLVELAGPVPERVKMTVSTVRTEQLTGHCRILLSIKVNRYITLPAYLLMPNDIKRGERRPGIIALHGHLDYGFESTVGCNNAEVRAHPYRADGKNAVEAGYVVIVPCYWGWSIRNGHLPLIGKRDKCNVIQMVSGMYGLNILALHLQDAQAALDVLCQQVEVDSERIGCIGHSYGGRTAMWLSALDQRVKVCVASGCANMFRERSLQLNSCAIQYFPGILQYGDVQEVFGLIAPRPLQIICGTQDSSLRKADRDAIYAAVKKVYNGYGATQMLEYALHDKGHQMEWTLAEQFLRKYL